MHFDDDSKRFVKLTKLQDTVLIVTGEQTEAW